MKRQTGLTLVELLIALSLCAGLGLLSYRALSALIDSREHIAQHNQRWREVALFFGRLENDLMQTVARDAQDGSGRLVPGLGLQFSGQSGSGLLLTRFRGDQAGVERVGYRLEGTTLLLREANELALSPAGEGDPVLRGVRAVRWEFLGYSPDWQPRWPVEARNPALPRAVRVTLDLDEAGTVTRVFALR